MAKDHIVDYDTAAGNNTDVDGVDVGEGTAPSNINDAIREMMSHLAEFYKDTGGGIDSGGSGGAYTLTTNDSVAAYVQGQMYAFEANHAMPDTATATLNINAVGAKALRKNVSLPLEQNDIKANQLMIVGYEATNDVFHVLSTLGNSSPITTQGDLISGASGGATQRVALGTDGQVLSSDGTDAAWANRITTDTAQDTSTGGTAYDFTGIPASAKKITLILDEISLSGTDDVLIQLGDSGGFETTGYVATSVLVNTGGATGGGNSTAGFNISSVASYAIAGTVVIANITGNVWVASIVGKVNTDTCVFCGGTKTLSGALTQLRLTRSGTDTFDAGQANIIYG